MKNLIFRLGFIWLCYKHGQWRQNLEPKFNRPVFCRKTGHEIARTILDANKLSALPVLEGSINTANVFKSRKGRYGTIYLNPKHYNNQSLRTLAVAAHECGHAINFHLNKKESFLFISTYTYIIFAIICILALFTISFSKTNIWLFMIGAVPGLLLIIFGFLEEKGATYQGIRMLQKNNLIGDEEKDFVKQYLNSNLLDYVYKYFLYISWWNGCMALVIVAKIVQTNFKGIYFKIIS
ncbi:zinc metallopeptidase [Nostoc sp. UIC10630]|nr:zinc metallopeptidase [Nostoc sp. UIC 10630]NEU84034.1 zinc metallopeptidase [Nostoc sp. UIC 10630]